MPLDIWIARTTTFEAIHGPHTRGGLPADEVAEFLSEAGGVRNDDAWRFWCDGNPGWTAEAVLDVDATYLRLSMSQATSAVEDRLLGATSLATDAAARFEARAFEATAGRELRGEPSRRWIDRRLAESDQMRQRMEANGLAPLEFPFRNLDAVSNFLTWVVELPDADAGVTASDLAFEGLAVQERDHAIVVSWDWKETPFEAAWEAGLRLADRLAEFDGKIIFDGRIWDRRLEQAYRDRDGELATDFYRWWVDARDEWKSA